MLIQTFVGIENMCTAFCSKCNVRSEGLVNVSLVLLELYFEVVIYLNNLKILSCLVYLLSSCFHGEIMSFDALLYLFSFFIDCLTGNSTFLCY